MNHEQRLQTLLPLDALMQTLPAVYLSQNDCDRLQNGQRLALALECRGRVRVYGPDKMMVGTARVNDRGVLAPERLIANKKDIETKND